MRFKHNLAAGDTQPTSREPFRRYARTWLDSYSGRTARGLSPRTRESYRDAIERFAIPYFGTAPLDRIDPPVLRKFVAHLASEGLAPSSVRRNYAAIRALLATAYEDGRLRSDPAAGVRVATASAGRHGSPLSRLASCSLRCQLPMLTSPTSWPRLPDQRGALGSVAGRGVGR